MKKLILVTILVASAAMAETPVDSPERPDMKAGKLFTLRLTPKSKSLDVEVVGNQVATAELTDVGIVANLQIGGKTIPLTTARKGRVHVIDTPRTESPSRLEIRVEAGKKSEDFVIELEPRR